MEHIMEHIMAHIMAHIMEHIMEHKEIYTGIVLIVVGLCIRLFPSLITRLDLLLKKHLKNRNIKVDTVRLSKLLSNAMIILGVSLIIIRCLLNYMMLEQVAEALIPIFIPAFIVVVGVIMTLPSLK